MADTPCIIGEGITIKGNLSGAEELVIDGTVEGHISLKNQLTIRESGKIIADIVAESLMVHGQVHGNLEARDVVSLSSQANVVADINAPRVVIQDGARFKGRIEMDVELPKDI